VQTASTLPVFLLGLPSGALADIVDRRRYFAATQLWVALTALVLAALSLTGLLTAPLLVTHLSATQLVLLAVGGVLYTAGAVVLGRRRPDPVPHVFGYHEVWHTMTIAAGGCHFAAVLLMLG